ncbi:MAG TPA: PIN domain-containing protein [Rhizomicrobium sp.]|nr:PIN domain-containing protein [Rhizomicrobium sp.]
MILVDTSVWVDHLRAGDDQLRGLLEQGLVLAHPFVTGEVALGSLRQREQVVGALLRLPQATVAADGEVLAFIADEALGGLGIGYIDAHLLAATRLTRDASFWTRDRRLAQVAARLLLAADLKG